MDILKKANIILFIFLNSCNVTSNQYSDLHQIVSEKKHVLPVVSLIVDSLKLFDLDSGIYVKGVGTGQNWQGEKANYFSREKVNMSIAYFLDGDLKFEETGKLKVSGGGSRKQPQKSFNISADNFFNYPVFQNLSFQRYSHLRLRVSGQDWRETHFRDGLMHSLVSQINLDVQAYQPSVLYLNGQYWGIYNIREKFNIHYLKQHHGVVGNVDILEKNQKLILGSPTSYKSLLKYVEQHDLNQEEYWEWVEEHVDINNFIDYYSSQLYFANTDWPANNIKYWKSEEGKWRWFLHDTDLGFGFAPIWEHPGGLMHNTLEFVLNDSLTSYHNHPWSTFLFRKFLTNNQFKKEFIRKFAEHLETTFHPNIVLNMIDSLAQNIAPEMPEHINMWRNDTDYALQSIEDWNQEVEFLREFARKRPAIMHEYLDIYLKTQ